MASRGRGARAKGFQFERDIAAAFQKATGREFKRGLGQARGGGAEVPDVLPGDAEVAAKIHIECKRHKVVSIKAAMRQAVEDCSKRTEEDPLPVVVTKDDRKDILVTMRLQDFLPLFRSWLDQD